MNRNSHKKQTFEDRFIKKMKKANNKKFRRENNKACKLETLG